MYLFYLAKFSIKNQKKQSYNPAIKPSLKRLIENKKLFFLRILHKKRGLINAITSSLSKKDSLIFFYTAETDYKLNIFACSEIVSLTASKIVGFIRLIEKSIKK